MVIHCQIAAPICLYTFLLKLLQVIHQCIYIYIRSVTDFDHDRCYLKSMQCEIDFVCAVDTKTEQDNKVHSVVYISGHGMELTCSVSMPR